MKLPPYFLPGKIIFEAYRINDMTPGSLQE